MKRPNEKSAVTSKNSGIVLAKNTTQFATNKYPINPNCADLMSMAERELAAFFGAVTELFGSELAELSAEEWLRELKAAEDLPTSTRGWRWLTAKASARLANRANTLSLSSESATI